VKFLKLPDNHLSRVESPQSPQFRSRNKSRPVYLWRLWQEGRTQNRRRRLPERSLKMTTFAAAASSTYSPLSALNSPKFWLQCWFGSNNLLQNNVVNIHTICCQQCCAGVNVPLDDMFRHMHAIFRSCGSTSVLHTACTIIGYPRSRDNSVGIATRLQRMDGHGSIPGRGKIFFSLLHSVQTCYGAHPASYPMGTGGFFLGCKAAGAWSWPLIAI
jgi:hypothetical protein